MGFEKRVVCVKNALAPERRCIPDIDSIWSDVKIHWFIGFSGDEDIVITGRFEAGTKTPAAVGIVDG
jgi:hypothetical protein